MIPPPRPLGPTDYRAAPRLARWLLAIRVPRDEREFVKGDLDEGYAAQRAFRGAWAARAWYWRQVFSFLKSPWPHPAIQPPLQRRGTPMNALVADLRFALRSLRRAPLFAVLVTLTLMTGIGATSAVFSAVYSVLLAPAPYPEPDRLVMIWERTAAGEKDNVGFLTGDDIRRETKSFSSLAMISYWTPIVRVGDDARPLAGVRVSHEYFRTLGVRPWLGRDFVPEEDQQATRRVVILSYPLWRSLYAGDSSVVGRTTLINGVPYRVAGVLPEGFRDLATPQAELWAPLGYDRSLVFACRTCHHLRAVARLRPGVTLAAATRELDAFLLTLRGRYPDQYSSVGVLLPTLKADVNAGIGGELWGLLAAVALLLLLACANVGNLFLGRAGERETDLAIRMALGAERGRLVRLVSLEAVVLSLLGGALGVLTAWLGTRALLQLSAVPAQLAGRVRLALPVVGFAVAVTALSTLLGGTVPALLALGESTLADLRMGGRALVGRVRHRLRNGIVVAEVALAVLLLAGAGLQVRSLQRALAVRTGFEPAGVLALSISLRGARYDSAGMARAYYRRLLEEAQAIPGGGVDGAAVVSQLPLGGNFDASGVHREDKPSANPEEDPSAQRFAVSPAYLAVMRIPVLRGRGLTPADREGAAPVVLLNRAGAARIFGRDDPLGKRLRVGGMDGPWRTVVGVVENVRHLSLEGEPEAQIYLPFDQNPYEESDLTLVARAGSGPMAVGAGAGLTRVAKRLDRGAAVTQARSMDEVIAKVVAARRLAISLVGGFAIIAVILTLGGLYGVMAASVAERFRELGLRAALGATPGKLVRMILGRGLVLTLAGTVLGVTGLLAASGLLRRFVFGVSAADPLTLAAVALGLGLVALLACLIPAIRATRVDPLIALRE